MIPVPTGSALDAPSPAASAEWPWLLAAETLTELVAGRAALTPDAPMLIDEHGETVTCAELDRRASRVARALAAEGIGPGTRVCWQLPTRISTVLVLVALRRLGARQAPMVPVYREREIASALVTTDAEVLLVPGVWKGVDYVELAVAATAGFAGTGRRAPRLLRIGHEAPEADGPAGPGFPAADPDEVAWVYFTSGSTGAPKGARHSDRSLITPGTAFAGLGELAREPGEAGAMAFPVAHVGGIQYLVAALAAGFPILLLEAFVPAEAVALFRRHGVTTTGGAPPFYTAFVAMARASADERLIPTLRSLKGGGAPCPPHLVDQVADALGARLAHDYGMTEVPMIAVAAPSDPAELRAATDGRPVPANRVRFVDADGNECPAGAVGEVQVSGPGVCHGYTDAAETAKAFTDDGWFRTGDLGVLHPSGHIEIVGRVKDLIIRKGENIAPQEVEILLARHPAVAEVAVIGLPDRERGELVCAVLVPRPGERPPTLDELGAWLTEAGLMRQKLPERVEVVEALPRTGLAKVAKAQLRSRFS